MKLLFILDPLAHLKTYKAVSYTHLDVYKRQVYVTSQTQLDDIYRVISGHPLVKFAI